MKTKVKNVKGITLIALVITIIEEYIFLLVLNIAMMIMVFDL